MNNPASKTNTLVSKKLFEASRSDRVSNPGKETRTTPCATLKKLLSFSEQPASQNCRWIIMKNRIGWFIECATNGALRLWSITWHKIPSQHSIQPSRCRCCATRRVLVLVLMIPGTFSKNCINNSDSHSSSMSPASPLSEQSWSTLEWFLFVGRRKLGPKRVRFGNLFGQFIFGKSFLRCRQRIEWLALQSIPTRYLTIGSRVSDRGLFWIRLLCMVIHMEDLSDIHKDIRLKSGFYIVL